VNSAGGSTAAIVHQEIERALRQGASIETTNLTDRLSVYQQGYRDALGAVAAAFGVLPNPGPEVIPEMLVERNDPERTTAQYIARAWRAKSEMPV
jgi:hypothetical protein